ncbi:MAG: GerMN domain-containing protein [bacterium]
MISRTRNIVLALVIVVILVVGYFGARWYFSNQSDKITDFASCAAAGYPIMESYPRQCRAPSGVTYREDVSLPEDLIDLIRVDAPIAGSTVASPVTISGQARGSWYFEGSFPIEIKDASGMVIGQGVATAKSDWMTNDFVLFTAKIAFSGASGDGSIVLKRDNPSGLPQNDNQLKIPVVLRGPELLSVKAYFSNLINNPGALDCTLVYAVTREIPGTQAVARAAIEELLKGPTASEKTLGFETAINPGVKIQKLTIENGVAKIDFDAAIEKAVGGSCRTGFIRAQIEQTLLQFPTVTKVIISVDDRTEDILQP